MLLEIDFSKVIFCFRHCFSSQIEGAQCFENIMDFGVKKKKSVTGIITLLSLVLPDVRYLFNSYELPFPNLPVKQG